MLDIDVEVCKSRGMQDFIHYNQERTTMNDLDHMVAEQLRSDCEFRAEFIAGIIANLQGESANRYDDASPSERRRYAQRQLSVFGGIIGDAVNQYFAARQMEAREVINA